MAPTIVAVIGLALLVALAIAVAWQGRHRPADRSIVYGVEESIEFIEAGLSEEAAKALRTSDVRRILEWSVRYLQDPAVRRERGLPSVAGGIEAAQYVQDRAIAVGFSYDGDLIVEVLSMQSEFLAELGAIGAPVPDNDEVG